MNPECESPGGLSRRAAWIVVAAVFITSAWFEHREPGWNVNTRLNLTYAIVDFGSVEISPYLSQPEYHTQDVALFEGRYYSDKIIGTSLLGMPAYWALRRVSDLAGATPSPVMRRYVTRTLSVSICAALTVLVMAALLRRMGAGEGLAWATALIVHFGTLLFAYSMLFFPYSPAALFSLWTFYLLMGLRLGGARALVVMFAAGLGLGAAMLCDYLYFWIFLAMGGYAIHTVWSLREKWGGIILFLGGAAIPLLIFAVYVYALFGRLVLPYEFETYHAFEGMKERFGFSLPRLNVLYYITAHPYRGILAQSPFLLGALAGLWMMLRRGSAWRVEAGLCAALVVVYLLFNASYFMWWGGWTMGPRHLIPMLPFWGIWFAAAWMRAGRNWRVTLAGLAAVSVFLVVAAAMVNPQIPQGHETDVLLAARVGDNLSAPQYYFSIPAFFRGGIAPNAVSLIWPGAGLVAIAPLVAMWAGVAWMLIVKFRKPVENHG